MSLLVGYVLHRQLHEEAGKRLHETAAAIQRATVGHLEKHRQAITSLAWVIDRDPVRSQDNLNRTLEEFHAVFPGFLTMLVADIEGNLIATYPSRTAKGEVVVGMSGTIADRSYFQVPMTTGRPYVSGVFRGRKFGTDPIVAASAPIHGSEGRSYGIVEGSLDLKALRRFNLEYETLVAADLILVDPSQTVVFSSNPHRFPPLTTPKESPTLAALLRLGKGDVHEYDRTDTPGGQPERMLVGSSRFSPTSGDPPWTVLVEQPLSEVRLVVGNYLWMVAFTLAALLATALIAVGTAARTITRPIEAMTKRLREVAAEELPKLPAVVDSGGVSEVAALAESFDALAGRLRASFEELRRTLADREALNASLVEAGRVLEERVRERTAELQSKSERYAALMHTSNDLIHILDLNGNLTEWNEAFRVHLQRSNEELAGLHVSQWDAQSTPEQLQGLIRTMCEQGGMFETLHRRQDGSLRHMEINAHGIRFGGVFFLHAAARDITERKAAEEILRGALAEKEVLLREVHHRVKNNLQVVSALLHLKADHTTDPGFREIVRESQGRIRSMALVHEQLYQSRELARLDFKSYLVSLITQVRSASHDATRSIRFELELAESTLDLNAAIPCGLLVNELLTNVLKHAFPKHREQADRTVRVTWKEIPSAWELTVADNGRGMDAAIDWKAPKTLGLRLVQMLTKQLKGTVELTEEPGCRFTITIPKA
jgi:PAS domain S-box-containing protein